MIDRDKVISRLQIVRTWAEVGKNYNGIQGDDCLRDVVDWIDDALALLKEQGSTVLTLEEPEAGRMTDMEKAVKNVRTVLTWARYGHLGPYNCEKVKKLLAEALEALEARATDRQRAGEREVR